MTKKYRKMPFMNENRLASFLVLANYPEYRKQTFSFEYLKNIRPEKYRALAVLKMLFELRKKMKFKMKDFVFDKSGMMPAENENWRKEAIRRISKKKSKKVQKVLDNILQSRFNFSDLELAMKEYEDRLWEIIEYINFEIQMTIEAQEKIVKMLEKYIEIFMKGKLITDEKKYFNFEEHKEEFFWKTRDDPAVYTKNLVFTKDDFKELKAFRFYEGFLALEEDRLIEINSIAPTKDENNQTVIPIGFTLTPKYFERTGKETKKKILPVFKKDGKMRYIYWPNNKHKIKIGEDDERCTMLIKFMLAVGYNKPQTIEKAYEAIKKGRHHTKTRSYRDLKIGAVKDAIEKLNKIGIYPLRIEIDEDKNKRPFAITLH